MPLHGFGLPPSVVNDISVAGPFQGQSPIYVGSGREVIAVPGSPVRAHWKAITSGPERAAGNIVVSLPYTATPNGSGATVNIANIPLEEAVVESDITVRIVANLTETFTTVGHECPKLYVEPCTNFTGSLVPGQSQQLFWWGNESGVAHGNAIPQTQTYVYEYLPPPGTQFLRINAVWSSGDDAASTLTINSLSVTRVEKTSGLTNTGYAGNQSLAIDTNAGTIFIDRPINNRQGGGNRALYRLRQYLGTESGLMYWPQSTYLYANSAYGTNGYQDINGAFVATAPLGSINQDNSLCNVWEVNQATAATQELRGEAHGGEWGLHEFMLSAAITTTPASGTSEAWAVYDSSNVEVDDTYAVNNERVQVTAINSATSIQVTRGYGANSGVPATHAINAIGFNYFRDHLIQVDDGDGTWQTLQAYNYSQPNVRTRQTNHTRFYNSDALSSPFATQDTTLTYFRDGVIRSDRTFTFLVAKNVDRWFSWMKTFFPGVAFKGVIGNAGRLIAFLDQTTTQPSVPPAPTLTAVAGGSLTSGTQYTYEVTWISASPGPGNVGVVGDQTPVETLPGSSTSITPSGSDLSVKVAFAVPAGVYGCRIYRQTATGDFFEVVQFASGDLSTISWTDTGVANGSYGPPDTSTYIGNDDEWQAESANWAALYEPVTGLVTCMAVDPDQILAQPGVDGFRCQVIRNVTTNNVNKIYFHADFAATAPTGNTNVEPLYPMPEGSVFQTTVWEYVYLPADSDAWWTEAKEFASAIKQLPTLYPST